MATLISSEANVRQAVGLEGGIRPGDQKVQGITQAQIARRQQESMRERPHEQLNDFEATFKAKQHSEAVITGDVVKLSKAKDAEAGVRKAAEQPFKDLGSAEQESLINASSIAIARIPELQGIKGYLDSLDPVSRMDVLSGMLANIDTNGDVADALLKGDGQFIATAFPKKAELVFAEEALTAKKTEQQENKEDIDANATALTAAEAGVKAFDSATTPPGAKAIELSTAQAELDSFLGTIVGTTIAGGRTQAQIKEVFTHKNDLKQRMDRLDDLIYVTNSANSADPDLPALKAELRDLLKDQRMIDAYGAAYDEKNAPINALEAQKKQLEKDKMDLTVEVGVLAGNKTRIDGEIAAAQGEVDAQQGKREDEYVVAAQEIMVNALQKLYQERLTAGERTQEEDIQAFIDKQTDPQVKKVLAALGAGKGGRWKKIEDSHVSRVPGLRGGEKLGHGEVRRFDNGRIKEDALTYINQGQEVFMKNVIRDQEFPDRDFNRRPLTAAEQAQIDKVYENPRFRPGGDIAEKASKELFRHALQRDLLKTSDIERFESTDVGRSIMEQAKIDHASWIEQQKKAMGFVGGTKDFLKKHPKMSLWLMLMLLWPGLGTLVGGIYLSGQMLSKAKEHGAVEKPKKEEPRHAPAPLPEAA